MRRVWVGFLFVFFSFTVSVLAADLRGQVVYRGKPKIETVPTTADREVCGAEVKRARIEVGPKGGLKNAVVWLEGVQAGDLTPREAILDQRKCQFIPFITLVPVGSTLQVTSSDPILHNAHGLWDQPASGTAFNVAVPIPGMKVPVRLQRPGRIRVRCDAGHTWMEAYVIVQDHPYYAVTDVSGEFRFQDLPAGEYTLHVWHPVLGERTQRVKVPDTVTVVYPAQSNP